MAMPSTRSEPGMIKSSEVEDSVNGARNLYDIVVETPTARTSHQKCVPVGRNCYGTAALTQGEETEGNGGVGRVKHRDAAV